MYKLSEAAASDIEDILDKSLVAFGTLQTEDYYAALKHCLGATTPKWAGPRKTSAPDIAASRTKVT